MCKCLLGDIYECDGIVQFLVELKQIKWRPRHFGTKQHWKDRINNIRKGRKESEDTDKVEDASMDVIPLFDEMCVLHVENDLDAKVRRYGM